MIRCSIFTLLAVSALAQSGTNEAPETSIVDPIADLYIKAGTSYDFRGEANDPDGDDTVLTWEFCADGEGCMTAGDAASFTFESAGVFEVVCYARDDFSVDNTPASVTVHVYEDNVPPRIGITSPVRRTVEARVGDVLHFEAAAVDPDGTYSQFWTFGHSPQDRVDGPTLDWRVPAAGNFVVIAVAVDNQGEVRRAFRRVRAVGASGDVAPTPTIVSPSPRQVVERGSAISLIGLAQDPDSSAPALNWRLSDGRVFSGDVVNGVPMNESGRISVQLIASDGTSRRSVSVDMFVIGRDDAPSVEISSPPTDLRLQPGDPVNLDGTVKNGAFFRKYFRWTIETDDGKTVLKTTRLSRPGDVHLPQGDYRITLTAFNPMFSERALQSSSRRIRVQPTNESEFLNNHAFDEAAPITPGRYENLIASGEEFFSFDVARPGQVINIDVRAAQTKSGGLSIALLDGMGNMLGSTDVEGRGALRVIAPTAGTYVFKAKEGNGGYTKHALDFGFGVTVLNPALYMPDVHWDESQGSRMVVVNPTTEGTAIDVIGYDQAGIEMVRATLDLAAKGRVTRSLGALFPDQAGELAWVRVDSGVSLRGMCLTETYDGREAYAVTGSSGLAADLYVPHIAQQVEQWYTRAMIANAVPETTNILLRSEAPQQLLDLHDPFDVLNFDFLDIFGGSLPSDVAWGTLHENDGRLRLAAVEVFGKLDGSRQVAGLTLADAVQDNPNFFYIRRNIYFTHIARDTAQFWTGIAIVNIDDLQRSFRAIAYGTGGAEIGTYRFSMDAGEKIVTTADAFIGEFADVTEVDWLAIEADEGIVGYELFGTHDNRRLAGLEASSGLAPSICMPHVDGNVDGWFGIAIVNAGNAPADVTFVLYDDSGQVLAETTRTIAAKEKFVDLLTSLYGTIPSNAGWVECRSDGGMLTGFELFGDNGFDKMSGVLAQ